MKDYSVSTHVVKLKDYLEFILDNFLKESLWDKTWVLFDWGFNKVYLSVTNINVKEKTLSMRLVVNAGELYNRFQHGWNDTYETLNIPYDKNHRNIDLFVSQIINRTLFGVGWVERRIIENKRAYKEASKMERDYEERLISIANEFLDEENVTHEKIREAYIDKFVNDAEIPDYTSKVYDEYRGTILAKLFMMLCLFMGAKDDVVRKYEKMSKLNGFEIGNIRKEVRQLQESLETDDFTEEAKLKLEPVKG